jgi:hypothetical protein
MTLAYCINAHSRPSQCLRLVGRLLADDPTCRVFLHYDKKGGRLDLDEFAGPRVQMVRQRSVYWGSTQLVDVFREMFRLALDQGCSYSVMLTGQDYPLRNLEGLEADLCTYDVWGSFEPLFAGDGSCNWEEGRRRYTYWWWHADNPSKLLRRADALVAKLFNVPVSHREPPLPTLVHYRQYDQLWWGARTGGPGVPLYTGRVWMGLSSDALKAVCSAPRRLVSYFHHVPCAAEAFFHTVLGNTKGLRVAPRDPWFVRHPHEASHPDVLTSSDLSILMASGAIFARKFDESVDSSVLDRLDVLSRLSQAPTPRQQCKARD